MLARIYRLIRRIREINQRYSKPHIEMTAPVRVALMGLRVYLLILVGLILYKFILIVS